MEVYHASNQEFEEFSCDHKELGHHFAPDKKLCLDLVTENDNHFIYVAEIPDSGYWEMEDCPDWTQTENFLEKFMTSIEYNRANPSLVREIESLLTKMPTKMSTDDQATIANVFDKHGLAGIKYYNEHEKGLGNQDSYLIFLEENIELVDRLDIYGAQLNLE